MREKSETNSTQRRRGTKTAKIELKPCPWCGSLPKFRFITDVKPELDDSFWALTCSSKTCCAMPGTSGETKSQAATNWNLRAPSALEGVALALFAYHRALDNREHGGIAADRFVKSVERIFVRPWIQGATLEGGAK